MPYKPEKQDGVVCPCCNRPFDAPAFTVDLTRNVAITPLGKVRLKPMEAEILYALWSRGRPVKISAVVEYVYGQRDEPENGPLSVRITVSKMRKALEK